MNRAGDQLLRHLINSALNATTDRAAHVHIQN